MILMHRHFHTRGGSWTESIIRIRYKTSNGNSPPKLIISRIATDIIESHLHVRVLAIQPLVLEVFFPTNPIPEQFNRPSKGSCTPSNPGPCFISRRLGPSLVG